MLHSLEIQGRPTTSLCSPCRARGPTAIKCKMKQLSRQEMWGAIRLMLRTSLKFTGQPIGKPFPPTGPRTGLLNVRELISDIRIPFFACLVLIDWANGEILDNPESDAFRVAGGWRWLTQIGLERALSERPAVVHSGLWSGYRRHRGLTSDDRSRRIMLKPRGSTKSWGRFSVRNMSVTFPSP